MTDIRLEVWDRLGTAGFEKKIAILQTISDSARLQPVNGIGEGRASLPDTFERIAELLTVDPITPANNEHSLIRAYLDGDISGVDPPYVEWTPDQVIPPSESESGRFEISGLGREAMVKDPVVEPWDWDGSADFFSTWPDWIYGGRDVVGPVEVTFAPHIFDVWNTATSVETFEILVSIDGAAFQTATIDTDASAFEVEQALEALAYGMTVEVGGSGTMDDPWRITILGPTGFYVTAIGANPPSGVARLELLQFGKLLPVGWTESRVGSTNVPHGVITEWGATLGGGTLPADCSAWVFFRGQEFYFPGVQTIRKVLPGGIYFLPPVYLFAEGAAADVRVVVRDLNENLLAFEEISLVADTVTQSTGVWTGPAVVGGTGNAIIIPEGVYEIVYRYGHIGTGTPPDLFIACPSMREGLPPSTIGRIVGELYADWTTDHAGAAFPLSYWVHGDGGFYLALDFDDTTDSAGNAWPREESITIKRGERFDRVLAKIVGLGYEWRIVPGAVDGYYLLQIFTAPTLGTDYSAADTPTIRAGRDITRRALRRWIAKTGALIEGANQFFSHAADAGARAGWGVSSEYQVRLDYESAETAIAAAQRVSEQLRKTRSLVINLADIQQPTVPIPGRDYVAGDIVRILDPPTIIDDPERVWSINYARDENGLTWEVQLGNQSFIDSGGSAGIGAGRGSNVATTEAVRYLMEQQELVRAPMPEPLPTPLESIPQSIFVIVAAVNSPQYWKDVADFQCDGSLDNIEIQTALGLMTGIGGYLILAPGDYELASSLTVNGMNHSIVIMGHGAKLNASSSITNASGRWIFSEVSAVSATRLPTLTFDGLLFDGQDVTDSSGISVRGNTLRPHVVTRYCVFQRFDNKFIYCDTAPGRRFDMIYCTFRDSVITGGSLTAPQGATIQFNDGSAAWKARLLGCVFESITLPAYFQALTDLSLPGSGMGIVADCIAENCSGGSSGLMFYTNVAGDGCHDNWVNGTWVAAGNG